ncbi:MAG: hypothetical protein KA419_02075 [Acidobacteria bacterium]|nr:hypothetical protein [Acidobacteriota bacterium]
MEQDKTLDTNVAGVLAKAAKLAGKAAAASAAAERLAADVERNAFTLAGRAEKALTALAALEGFPEALARARARVEALRDAAESTRRRAQASIPALLAEKLAPAGLVLEGTLPELRCGLLTLRFRPEAKKPVVEVFYGPGVARLKVLPVDAEAVAEAVADVHRDLAAEPLDEVVFLRGLRVAYRMAFARRGEPDDGRPAPLPDVMAEFAFARQAARFRSDPVREAFASYGRVRFSFDLFRLQKRELDGETLRLGVASREQTRKPEHHLWVPTDLRGHGTHFADLAFRRAE